MDSITDFLVIGSGIAGLSFALKVADAGTVAIITKKNKAESNTNYAQGGIAAVFASSDSFDKHIADTLQAGAGLCHRDAVELIVREGPERVKELVDWGVKFTGSGKVDPAFDLGREGGHSQNRIVHARDHTGFEVERALLEALARHPNLKIYENFSAIDLITEHHLARPNRQPVKNENCWGAYVYDNQNHQIHRFLARATVLATGGCGQVYRHTTNPAIATGDGVAMAYRTGVPIANMEFMQFHPTTLYHPEGRSFLISEAVRGFGAILRSADGEMFMKKYHAMAELAPRDIVARAIDNELKRRGEPCVYLDITHKNPDEIRERFPHIYQNCQHHKIDMTREWIPVVPAAHYACGGVITDLQGQTTLQGLYACGEVACTGVHGANRLASNSLLEALVFAHHASRAAKVQIRQQKVDFPDIPPWDDSGTFNQEEWVLIAHDKYEIQNLMWDYVGIVRTNFRLQRAWHRCRLILKEINDYYRKTKITEGLLELRNLATTAWLIIKSARQRRESRGLHFNTDFPNLNNRSGNRDTVLFLNTQS